MSQKKIFAIRITRPTTVAVPTGGAIDVAKGKVLNVPTNVSAEDAAYLIALGKAENVERGEKSEKAEK